MHRNYYLFKHQLDFLNSTITHCKICRCYTYRKDELVLSLLPKDGGELSLRISVQIQFPYLLLYPGQHIKDPQIEFFPEITGQRILHFDLTPFDKLVSLKLTSYKITMIFFGQNPNILLIDENNQMRGTFKKKFIPADKNKRTFNLDPEVLDHQKILEKVQQDKEHNLLDFLNHYLGGFNAVLSRELCFLCSLDPEVKAHMITPEQVNLLVQNCIQMMQEMKQTSTRIYLPPRQPARLSLLALHHLGKDADANPPCEAYNDVNTAWKQFIFYQFQQNHFSNLHARLKEIIQNRLAYLRRTMHLIEETAQMEQRKKEAELKGNLLLANISRIPKGTTSVDLPNIFSNADEIIHIKLNPAKSVQENARKYFEKYKDIEQKKLNLSVRRDTLDGEYLYWQNLAAKFEQTSSLTQLDKIKKELIERGSLQDSESAGVRKETVNNSFHRLLLGKKWEVYIGKNARNNELLTFKFAHKFDLWFHAQGVTGSHVVLHLGAKDSLPPPEIMEQTASVAAYFSSAKHSQLVPVNYTQVRYVRKIRNKPAGTVQISNEKTLFVRPQKLG